MILGFISTRSARKALFMSIIPEDRFNVAPDQHENRRSSNSAPIAIPQFGTNFHISQLVTVKPAQCSFLDYRPTTPGSTFGGRLSLNSPFNGDCWGSASSSITASTGKECLFDYGKSRNSYETSRRIVLGEFVDNEHPRSSFQNNQEFNSRHTLLDQTYNTTPMEDSHHRGPSEVLSDSGYQLIKTTSSSADDEFAPFKLDSLRRQSLISLNDDDSSQIFQFSSSPCNASTDDLQPHQPEMHLSFHDSSAKVFRPSQYHRTRQTSQTSFKKFCQWVRRAINNK